MVWYAYYRDPKDSKSVNQAELDLIRAGGGLGETARKTEKFNWSDLRTLTQYRQLWGIYLGQFATASTLYFFLTWFPTYLVTEKHMPMLKAVDIGLIPC